MQKIGISIIILALMSFFGHIQQSKATTRTENMKIIDISRNSSVEIISPNKSKGSGFIIADQYVATAFHVIASISYYNDTINWSILPDIQVKLSDGEILKANCVTLPTQSDLSPVRYDFAVLKLKEKPKKPQMKVELANKNDKLSVGDDIIFSGYPLATPGMVTHKGMISGFDDSGSLIMLQAAINKGNSGGAVLTHHGKVIGIISMREGGISKGLGELVAHIDQTSKNGFALIMGVNTLKSTRDIIVTLDNFISTGIGYAINIEFLRSYLHKHPELTK